MVGCEHRLRKSGAERGNCNTKISIFMINFWRKVSKSPDKLPCVVFRWLHYRNEATQWHLGIKQILINCGIPLAKENVGLVSDYQFEKFIKAKCQDLVFKSWQIMLQSNFLCDNYRLYQQRLVLEVYLKTLFRSDRVELAIFRCAATALPNGKIEIPELSSRILPLL